MSDSTPFFRISFACATLAITFTCFHDVTTAQESTPRIVDTHVHFWDLERPEGISWINPEDQTLYRTILPEHHLPLAKANNISGVIVVQAGQSLADNQWNLDITAKHPAIYRGVVGNLSKAIGTDEFEPLFLKLCEDERYVGYRLSGRYHDEITDELIRDLKLTAKHGRSVDILVGAYSLKDVSRIAVEVPELRLILDHFGNVRLDQPLEEAWLADFREAAGQPNVYCKVSALFGRFQHQPAPLDLDVYRPILDLAVECFGPDRIIFGSDWPITKRTSDYANVIKLTKSYFDELEADVANRLFCKNSLKFYKIDLPQNRPAQTP